MSDFSVSIIVGTVKCIIFEDSNGVGHIKMEEQGVKKE